ncbi:hypothetical protein E2542_SST02705 [Spatholobus suberectus]|nr:hypothetical protein E2542_SST02705 [Spatholobus suberectus]
MASSLGIACGGNNRVAANLGIQKRCGVPLQPPRSVAIRQSTARAGRISAAMATERARSLSVDLCGKREGGTNDAVEGQERLDRWMRESVVEIVRNLREAPLLVQVFPKRNSGATAVTTEKRVVVEDWPAVKESWESGETPVPEGVIFVEELDGGESESGGGERTTRVWGIVVQGKGVGCGPVCYLLKTSRVGSGPGPGMGVFSTHFCLVKVKNFRETVQSQLKNCWLLQSQCQWQGN